MTRWLSVTVTALLLPLACAKQAGGESHTTTSQGATESGEPTDTSSSSGDDADDADDSDDGVLLLIPADVSGLCSVSELSLCDEIAQDCPESEKCVPFGFDDCSYPRCVPITGDKPAGEPCTVDAQAIDDCDGDSWCYPGTLGLDVPGVCIPFCQHSRQAAVCDDPSLTCVFDELTYHGVLGCRPRCEPLTPTGCEPWERCTFTHPTLPEFGCVLAGGVVNGEVCSSIQACDSGVCVIAEALLECAGASCCSPWCDVLAPDCALGLECVVFFIDEPESTVGVCATPPP